MIDTPLLRLWQGVLLRAIEDAQGRDGAGEGHAAMARNIRAARVWLTRGNTHEFRTACEACNLDPDRVKAWARTQDALGWPLTRKPAHTAHTEALAA